MKRVLAAIGALIVLGAVLGMAYALAEPPSKTQVVHSIGALHRYSFRRTVTFNQYHVYVADRNGTWRVERTFAYVGEVVATGQVDLNKGIVTEDEQFYANGSVIMTGHVVINLKTKEVSGSIKLANGSEIDVLTFWKEYFGIPKDQALTMFKETLPLASLRSILENSEDIEITSQQTSLSNRLLQGLGLEGKTYSYKVKTPSGRTWILIVDSGGRPVKFASETENMKVVVEIQHTG